VRAQRSVRRSVPSRIQKHWVRLGLRSLSEYVDWCTSRGLSNRLNKSWEDLEEEWKSHVRELARITGRQRVDRRPLRLLLDACAGRLAADEISRPRWRTLAKRIEQLRLCEQDRLALARHRGQWLRPAESWSPRSHNTARQFDSLLRHLFVEFPVPRMLNAAWVRRI